MQRYVWRHAADGGRKFSVKTPAFRLTGKAGDSKIILKIHELEYVPETITDETGGMYSV